jgi:hypothetical protein
MHSLLPATAGWAMVKNITAISAITVTAVITLTGHIKAEADPITKQL